MIADAEQDQHFSETGICFKLSQLAYGWVGIIDGVHVIERKIVEHTRAVGRFPPEDVVRKNVPLSPSHLLRDKGIDAGIGVELRDVPGIAERIRVISDFGGHSEFLLEVSLGIQEMTRPRFPTGRLSRVPAFS